MNNFKDMGIIFKTMMILTMLTIIINGLKIGSDVLAPLLLALFLAIVSASYIQFFISKGVPRFIAWIFVLITIVGFIALLGVLVSSSANEFSQKLPFYITRLDTIIDGLIEKFGFISSVDIQSFKNIYHPGNLLKYSVVVASGVSEVLSNSFLIILTIIFMLVQRHSFVHKVQFLSQNTQNFEHFKKMIQSVDKYLLILSVISLLTGISVYVVLRIMNIDFALMWALLAFFFNFIPNIGSAIAAVPPVLLALIQYDAITAGIVALFYLIINIVFGSILQPRFIGKGMDLSILVVFLSLLFWGWIFGPVGMFLSVPLTLGLKISFEAHESSKWIGVILGEDPLLKNSEEKIKNQDTST